MRSEKENTKKKLQLEYLKIESLFGHFNYEVNLKKCTNGITLLTAPNGYGKSTILKIIESIAIGDYLAFLDIDFHSIELKFDSIEAIKIKKSIDENQNEIVTLYFGRQSFKINNISDIWSSHGPSLEHILPITRIGPRVYRDDLSNEVIDRAEVIQRYKNHPIIRNKLKNIKWFDELRESFDIIPITVNRLKIEAEETSYSDSKRSQLMVTAVSDSVKDEISRGIRTQFEKGRELEASFPKRLISSLYSNSRVDKDSIIALINKIKAYEERYSKHGILPNVSTTELLRWELNDSNPAPFLVLSKYLEDICDKFAMLESLATKLDVFTDSINQLLSFKKIRASVNEGLTIELKYKKREKGYSQLNLFKKDEISLTTLSSGEQHLLIMFGKLVFNTSPTTLVLIDEPELSLHPEWQERFIEILENIRNVTKFNALIATHSPILIGNRWDDVVELAEQGGFDR